MLPLIDTHQHLVYPDNFNYPWIADAPVLQRPFNLDHYKALTQGHGIEASIFMEVDVAEEDSAREAKFFAEQAENPDHSLTGVIASGRPENDGFAAYLDDIASPRLKAVRRVLHVVDDSVSQGQTFRDNIRLLGQRSLPFDICMLPRQHNLGIEMVDDCPNTTFILDHCGVPNISDPAGFESWHATLKQFAERPHVNAKLSGIVASGKPGAVTAADIKPYLDATLAAFGADRLVWGSDWPVCTMTTELPQWIMLFRDWLGHLSTDEQTNIANANARRIYSL